MKKQNSYAVILFFSTHYVIRASDVLKKNHIENKMIPVPRKLSSDCGYCIKINDDSRVAKKILEDNNIEYDRIEVIE